MANGFNSEVGQQQKTSGKGMETKRGSVPSPKLNMKTAAWPENPGKTGPNRNPTGVEKIQTYAKSAGL